MEFNSFFKRWNQQNQNESKHTELSTPRHWSWTRTLAKQRWPSDDSSISHSKHQPKRWEEFFHVLSCSFHVSLTLLYWFILSHKITKQGLQNQGAGKCEAEALGSSSCWFSGALRKEQEHEGTRWHMVTFHFPSHWFNRLISISLGQELKS